MHSISPANAIVLRVSRWKSAGMLMIAMSFALGMAQTAMWLWQWPSRTAFWALPAAFSVLGLAASVPFAMRLLSPPQLMISPEALVLRRRGKEIGWTWAEISKIAAMNGPLQATHVVVHTGDPATKKSTSITLPWGLGAGPVALRRTLRAAQGAALDPGAGDFHKVVAASAVKAGFGISIDTVRILIILGCVAFVAYAFGKKQEPDEVQLRCGHAYRFSASRAQLRMAFNTDGCPTVEDVEKQRIRPLGGLTQR